jgi:hypothetical protein
MTASMQKELIKPLSINAKHIQEAKHKLDFNKDEP